MTTVTAPSPPGDAAGVNPARAHLDAEILRPPVSSTARPIPELTGECDNGDPESRLSARLRQLRALSRTVDDGSGYPDGYALQSPFGRWVAFDRFRHEMNEYVVMQLRVTSKGKGRSRDLTERERMVARCAATGMPFKLIADACSISVQAASTYLLRAKRKLGASSKADLVRAIMHEEGHGPIRIPCLELLMQVRLESEWFRIFRAHGPPHHQRTETLTPAEREILAAILAGLPTAGIARQRGTAVGTVATQISAIMRKLEVQSRAALVASVLGMHL